MTKRLLAILEHICQSYNQLCADIKTVDAKRYDQMLNRLMNVKPLSINYSRPPKEVVKGNFENGHKAYVLANGYLCSCTSFKMNNRNQMGQKIPCKHLAILAGNAVLHVWRQS